MDMPDFDTPEGVAAYMNAQLIVHEANALGYCRSDAGLSRVTRVYLDLMGTAANLANGEGRNPPSLSARTLLESIIPKYKQIVPEAVREILGVDLGGIEERCREVLSFKNGHKDLRLAHD